MGCASSKRVEATAAADVYRPAPTSIALFDINTIEEPWLIPTVHHQSKPTHVPSPILEKLDKYELTESNAPHSWSELSKALEDLKLTPHPDNPPAHVSPTTPKKNPPKKNLSFRTLEELDEQLSNKKPESQIPKLPSKPVAQIPKLPPRPETEGIRPVSENIFIIRDRLGKGESNRPSRRDPLSEFPEKCPPRGGQAVVLYTTTLRGVRRTFEDCQRLRAVVEAHRVEVDERDVSLHGEFLSELKELVGEGVSVPRLFVKGRYVGGVEEVVELNESGRLGELLDSAGVGKGKGEGERRVCEGCGGARFVLCLVCSGSCKVLGGDGKGMVRCTLCNENGLVLCPLCHSH